MFGYVRVRRSELRVREYEYYQSIYCGLCRRMGQCTGQCSRLSLSYDLAYLALLRMALTGEKTVIRERRCIAHPFHKRKMMEPGEALTYAARVSALLTYEKCRDDVADSRGFRRLRARFRAAFFHRAYRKAKKVLPEVAGEIRPALFELRVLEGEKKPSVEEPAGVFARLLGKIFAYGLSGNTAVIAGAMGRGIGRYIYITDALDDLEKDAARGEFNPILCLYGRMPEREEREELKNAVIAGLADLEPVMDLFPPSCPEQKEILRNILYLGMTDTLRKITDGAAVHKEEKREQ